MIRNHRRLWASISLTGLGLALLPAVGCNAAAAATAPGLAHSYTASAHNVTASASGVLKLTNITEDGAAVSGNVAFVSPLAGSGPSTGTVSSTAVNFTAPPHCCLLFSVRDHYVHRDVNGHSVNAWDLGCAPQVWRVSEWGMGIGVDLGRDHPQRHAGRNGQLSLAMMMEDSSGNIIGALIEGNVSPGLADEPMGAGTIVC